jgi:hypothetical protein
LERRFYTVAGHGRCQAAQIVSRGENHGNLTSRLSPSSGSAFFNIEEHRGSRLCDDQSVGALTSARPQNAENDDRQPGCRSSASPLEEARSSRRKHHLPTSASGDDAYAQYSGRPRPGEGDETTRTPSRWISSSTEYGGCEPEGEDQPTSPALYAPGDHRHVVVCSDTRHSRGS